MAYQNPEQESNIKYQSSNFNLEKDMWPRENTLQCKSVHQWRKYLSKLTQGFRLYLDSRFIIIHKPFRNYNEEHYFH